MKKLLFVIMVLGATHYAQAQTAVQASSKTTVHSSKKEKKAAHTSAAVNPLSKNNFAEDFKGVSKVSWQKDDEFDVASFKLDNKKVQAYYDENGQLVGTITNTSLAELLQVSQKDIKKKYKGYTVTEVVRYDDNEDNNTDMVLYDTAFDADSYFVELSDGKKTIVLLVDSAGEVSVFKTLH